MKIDTKTINKLTFVEIENDAKLKVILSPYGGAIYEIDYDGVPMTSCEKDKKVWANSPSFAGKTVGRIAGRIKDGILKYEGHVYDLYHNERGKTCHHGGDGLFPFSNYAMDTHILDDNIYVDFYKDDDNSRFPGKLTHRVRYIIPINGASLRIEYKTVSDIRTPVNFTNHSYFALGEDSLDEMLLKVNADEVEGYDSDLIATGLRPVPEYLDWRKEKAIGTCFGAEELQGDSLRGIDHAFKVNNDGGVVLSLRGKKYKLELKTSYPVVHLYSYNFPNENEMMTNGLLGRKHGSLAIEPMYVPGDYESMTIVVGKPKVNYIEYHFSKENV